MSHSNKIVVVKRGSLLFASLAVVLIVGTVIQTVVRIDPFASLKATSKSVDPNLGVRMEGVNLKSYEKDKLVAKVKMDRLDVRQDKQHYDLFGVTDGVFYSKNGPFSFDAPRADWNVAGNQLNAPEGGHIKGKDADLKVPQFAYNSKTGIMNTLGDVKGKLLRGDISGDIQAHGVRYDVNNGSIKTGPIEFNGKIAMGFQDGDTSESRQWTFKAKDFEKDGDIWTYENGYGSDGDIILMADHIEHNRKTDVVTAKGHVRYFSSKTNMICDQAVIERKLKKATLIDNVQMLVKAKEKQDKVSMEDGIPPFRPVVPDEIAKSRPQAEQTGQTEEQKKLDDEIRSGKNMRDYPTICYAEKVVYWYKKGNRHAEITGSPQARQEMRDGAWRQVWTNTGFYDGELDTLKLVSSKDKNDTRMINSLGDDVTAETLQVSTKEGVEAMKGTNAAGTFMDYSDEIPKADKPKSGTTGGGKVPPPGDKAKPPLTGPIDPKKKGG